MRSDRQYSRPMRISPPARGFSFGVKAVERAGGRTGGGEKGGAIPIPRFARFALRR